MVVYNKLVRDRIIEIITGRGETATWHTATLEEFREALYQKLLEESAELAKDRSLGERIDLEEVLMAIDAVEGWITEDIEAARLAKARVKGPFEKRIILESVA